MVTEDYHYAFVITNQAPKIVSSTRFETKLPITFFKWTINDEEGKN